jgi:hypothetical protein
VWYAADPKRIPAKARRLIDSAIGSNEHIAISSISVSEIAMLVASRRLELTIDAELGAGPVAATAAPILVAGGVYSGDLVTAFLGGVRSGSDYL